METLVFYTPGTCALACIVSLEWLCETYRLCRVDRDARSSNAVVAPIADRRAESRLLPTNGSWERDVANEWLAYLASGFHAAFWPYIRPDRYTTEAAHEGSVKAAAERAVRRELGALDRHLNGRDWVLESGRSVLDAYVDAMDRRATPFVPMPKDFPDVWRHQKALGGDRADRFALAAERSVDADRAGSSCVERAALAQGGRFADAPGLPPALVEEMNALLLLDGWRIPNDGLRRDRAVILELALGLVVFTVVGAGFPIAISSIAARVPIPKRLMPILEGESLFNDASGLVCFRFAVAAALTGQFSVASASLTFLWVAGGGIAIGVAATLAVSFAQRAALRRFDEASGSSILVSLLLPFGAYVTAEQVHASGIFAAVGAGITMSQVELTGRLRATTRVQRAAVRMKLQPRSPNRRRNPYGRLPSR